MYENRILLFALLAFILAPISGAWSAGERVRYFIVIDGPVGAQDIGMVEAAGAEVRYAYSIVDAIAVEIPQAALSGIEQNPRVDRNDVGRPK